MDNRVELRDFRLPALLLAFSIVPALGGVARLLSVAHGTAGPAEARFLEAPYPVVVHVLSATAYAALGALLFSPALRRRWARAHRRAGAVSVAAGLVTAASGLWMTARYSIPRELQGPLLYAVRLAVGTAMIAALLRGLSAILRGQTQNHEAWMIRAYALAQGAGTQVFVLLPWMLGTGQRGGLTRDLLMTLAWALNVALAEWIIRARARQHSQRKLENVCTDAPDHSRDQCEPSAP